MPDEMSSANYSTLKNKSRNTIIGVTRNIKRSYWTLPKTWWDSISPSLNWPQDRFQKHNHHSRRESILAKANKRRYWNQETETNRASKHASRLWDRSHLWYIPGIWDDLIFEGSNSRWIFGFRSIYWKYKVKIQTRNKFCSVLFWFPCNNY